IGEPALDALRKAAGDGDLEIRRRAERIIQAVTGRIRAAAARRELAKLQGTWYTVSTSCKGTVTGEDKTSTITYENHKYVQRRNGQVWAAGTIVIADATATRSRSSTPSRRVSSRVFTSVRSTPVTVTITRSVQMTATTAARRTSLARARSSVSRSARR